MSIPANSNFIAIQNWLDEKLSDKRIIKADSTAVKNTPKTKGIYFWFMKQSCYPQLSSIISITPIDKRITKSIQGEKYDLVYLGTAGVRPNSSGTNNGHLQARLKWHLKDNKTINAFCSGTMSTFRRTIGCLLGNDLFENSMQDRIDEILSDNFIVQWIEYPGTFMDVVEVVNREEEILIKVLKPLCNLDKNPNAEIVNSSTYKIQQKRLLCESQNKTKYCINNGPKTIKEAKSNPRTPSETQIIETKMKNCVEFSVRKHENISDVASNIKNLPAGQCSVELISKDRKIQNLYINGKIRKIRTEGRTVSQFFNATDVNTPKWRLVQNEMNDKNNPIEVITVRVCKQGSSSNAKTKTKVKTQTHNPIMTSTQSFIDDIILKNSSLTDAKSKKLLIINCCDAKSMQPNNLNNAHHINYNFGAALNNARMNRLAAYQAMNANYFNNKTRNNAPVNQAYFMGALNPSNRRPVFDTYGSNHSPFFNPNIKALYINKIQNSDLHILIISGLYGLLHHSDYINDYHFEINKGVNPWGNTISNAINEFITQNNIDNNLVFYCLSGNYLSFIGQPNPDWTNLWRNLGGHGHNQASELIDFLNRI